MVRVLHHACWCSLLLLAFGCKAQPREAPRPDPEAAKQLIIEVLDDWRAGAKVQDRKHRSPPQYVAEELWSSGQHLLSYQLLSDGQSAGKSVRFEVLLNLRTTSGELHKQAASYLVTTEPARTVTRTDE